MTASEAGHKLADEIQHWPWYIAVGVGGTAKEPRLYVYFEKPTHLGAAILVKLAENGYEGVPVTVVETTRPIPAGEGK